MGGRGLWSWRADQGSYPCTSSCYVFHVSFAALRLVLLWLVTSVLLRNYRRARAELYRPAVDLQDYEMVELLLRRLKMWMGLSRTKEFRHKVRFEGMEIPPSRSSSTSDCKSLCLPPLDPPEPPQTPDSVDCGPESSWHPTCSSPCSIAESVGLGLGLTINLGVIAGGQAWKERAETEATLRRVLPAFDALLLQLDRVNQATEELYQTECHIEKVQRKSRNRCHGMQRSSGQDYAGHGSNGSNRNCHSVEKCTLKVEKNGTLGRPRPKREKCSQKTDRGSHKSAYQKSVQEDSLQKEECLQTVDTSPLETTYKMDGHVSKSETHHPKEDLSPIKVKESVSKIEASANEVEASPGLMEASPDSVDVRSQKTAKGSSKAASCRKKVNPVISRNNETVGCASKQTLSQNQTPIPTTAPSASPSSAITTPVPIPRVLEWNPPSYTEDLPSSLFQHPAHTTTMPTRKRKYKPLPLKNKIHPNTDRPISGHGKP